MHRLPGINEIVSQRHEKTMLYTSVVLVENRILLVPLSKITVRLVLSTEFVLPLTESCGDDNCQVRPAVAGREANLGLPNETGMICKRRSKNTHSLPVNLVLSIPPNVISALPTVFGVK